MTPAGWVALIPLAPLAGAVVLGLAGAPLQRRFGKGPVGWLACGTVALSFVLSVVAFFRLVGMDPEHRYLLARLFPGSTSAASRSTSPSASTRSPPS
jgi:hypothetical protein